MSASKRIAKEYADCSTSPPAGMTITLADENDLHKWHVVLEGPKESLYAGGTFGLMVELPTDYPFKPPVVHFVTRIYHPNVTNDNLGQICAGVLKPDNWKPALRLTNVLETLRQLLIEPNPDDPIETRIADEYRNTRAEFEKQVKFHVGKYAKGTPSFST